MIETNSAGGVVINNGKVLIVNQDGRSWSLPKGHIDSGEDEVTAAKREIYEETGVADLEFIKKLGTFKRHRIGLNQMDDTSEMKTIHVLLFNSQQVQLKPQDKRHPEARWVEPGEVSDLLTHPKDKEFFDGIISEITI